MTTENNVSGDGAKKVTIFVNGTPYEVDRGRTSDDQLLALIQAPPLPERGSAMPYSTARVTTTNPLAP